MASRATFAVEEYYHLYSRGNDKRVIFTNERDRLRFLLLLYLANSIEPIHLADYRGKNPSELFLLPRDQALLAIGAYCLMPNHFHLLVCETREGGITLFMRKLLTGYSMYFNLKHHRTGKLFEGAFKSEHITDDRHLNYLFAYIHLNPVKIPDPNGWAGKRIANPKAAESFLSTYSFSSYLDYSGKERAERVILDRQSFPGYFESPRSFGDFISEWLNFDSHEETPRGYHSFILPHMSQNKNNKS